MDRSASHRVGRGAAPLLVLVAAIAVGGLARGAPPKSQVLGLVPADDPLAPAQQALLRGDEAEASRQLAAVESDPKRVGELAALRPEIALLHASMVPLESRPDALLAVAAAWPGTYAADVALVAGLKALARIESQGFDPVLPLLPEEGRILEPSESSSLVGDAAREKLLEGMGRRLQAFRALLDREPTPDVGSRAPRDPALRDEARALLRDLESVELSLVRLRVGERPRLPQPFAEAIRVVIERVPEAADATADLGAALEVDRPRPAPLFERTFEAAADDAELPALDAGLYVVTLESPGNGWRVVRRLLVSDLELLVQTRRDTCVVVALLDGRPAAGVEVATSAKTPARATTDAKGRCVLPLVGDRQLRLTARRVASSGSPAQIATAWVEIDSYGGFAPRAAAHVFVDVPLHRRGEVVRGRIAARTFDSIPLAALADRQDSEPRPRPLAHAPISLRFWPHTSKERVIQGTTDGDGVLAFEWTLAADAPYGPVRVVVEYGAPSSPNGRMVEWYLADLSPFRVEAIERPPLLIDVAWPAPYVEGAPRPQVVVAASLPTGAPAARLAGAFTVKLGSFEERHGFLLDANGRAVLPIACDTLTPAVVARCDRCELGLEVVASDGQTIVKNHVLPLSCSQPARADDARDEFNRLTIRPLGEKRAAGDAVELAVAGAPRAVVLVTAGRAQFLWSDVVLLDEHGDGRTTLPTRAEWAPEVEVVASALARDSERVLQARVDLSLPPRAAPVRAELAEANARLAPHTRATLHFETRAGDGSPCAAQVAVSVVDESLFLLEEDRTLSPASVLRPRPDSSYCWCRRALEAGSPWQLLGVSFHDGLLQHDRLRGAPSGLGGGGDTTPANGGAGDGIALRDGFQPIAAFFAKVATDEQGRGSFEVAFPDDLTRWRVTLVVTTPDGLGEVTRADVTTERDPSLLLIPPRFLRQDDRVAIPSVVHCSDARGRTAELRADASRGLALGAGVAATARLALSDGGTIWHAFEVVANGLGAGSLQVDLLEGADGGAAGARLDGERRELRLLPRTLTRSTSATGRVKGRGGAPVELTPPRLDGALASATTLRLLGDRAARLDAARTWLTEYPYGCAEQTISRLVPTFAAARARRLRIGGEAPTEPLLTPQQARRFEVGMERLRDLKTRDGYRWWRGCPTDLRMTPVVLTGLALAREAGLDPASYGAVLDVHSGLLHDCVESLAAAEGDARTAYREIGVLATDTLSETTNRDGPEQLLAELAVAALRIDPTDERASAAVGGLARKAQPLSPSLRARAGRALVAAGDRDGAQRCWERLDQHGVSARCVVPLEDSAEAFVAARLDLACALGRPDAEIAAAQAELFELFTDGGFGTTWSTAVALCALAGAGDSPPPAAPQHLRIRGRGQDRSVTLDAASSWRATLDLGDATSVSIEAETECDVVAIAERRQTFDGVTGAPWATPFGVTRTLQRVEFGSDGASTTVAMEPDGDGVYACRVGDVLEWEVTVRRSPDVTYFVVTCPIPSGCELLGRGEGSETDGAAADDEQVAWAFPDFDANEDRRVRARFVVGRAGDVAWPAAQAQAMYRAGVSGASRGARLRATESAPAADTAPPTWLAPEVRRAELRRRCAVASWYDAPSLSHFPDDAIADEVRRTAAPKLPAWSIGLREWLDLLGPQRAWLFSGHAWSDPEAKLPEPKAKLLEPWVAELPRYAEGIDLIERWRRGDPALGTFERRLAALAWITTWRWGDMDAAELMQVLRADDVEGERAPVRAERLEAAVGSYAMESVVRQRCKEIVSRDDVRSRPDDAGAFEPLAEWQPILDFARAGVEAEEPSQAALAFAKSFVDFEPPELDGAAPLPEEVAFAGRLHALRAPLAAGLERRLLARVAPIDDDKEESALLDLLEGTDPSAYERTVERLLEYLAEAGFAAEPLRVRPLLVRFGGRAQVASALGARLVAELATGPEELGESLLAAFPLEERAKLPEPLLARGLRWPETTSLCADALVASPSGGAVVLAWLRTRPAHGAEELARLVPDVSAEFLARVDNSLLLDCLPDAENPARARIRAELEARTRHDPRPLAAELAQPRDVRARTLLVELLADARCEEIPWRANDVSASFWRMLLRSRLGARDAADELRHWLRSGNDEASKDVPVDEWQRRGEALLPVATLDDVGEGLLFAVATDLERRHFATTTPEELCAWLEPWEKDGTGRSLRGVLEVLPDIALRGAWDRLTRLVRDWQGQLRADDAEDLARYLFHRSGHSCEFVASNGERTVFEPNSREEWREALCARLHFDGALPDFTREPANLEVAWHDELVERGLALR